MKSLRIAVFGILVLAGQQATAQIMVTQWGVSAASAWADCTDWCYTWNLSPQVAASSGGLNSTAASVNVDQNSPSSMWPYIVNEGNNVFIGPTYAAVSLDTVNLNAPVLRAKSADVSGTAVGWLSALAFGIQGYQYTGTVPTTLTVAPTLEGTINNPFGEDTTGFSVGVWLRKPLDATTPLFPSPATSLGELVSTVTDNNKTVPVAAWEPEDVHATGSHLLNGLLTINLTEGDEFYLVAGLVASAFGNDASADASNTLTLDMSFVPSINPSTDLVAAGVAPVPEPETYAMMLVGVGLVGWQLRRKSKRTVAKRLE